VTARWLGRAPYDGEIIRRRAAGETLRKCRWCGTEDLPATRRSWCSQACVDEYNVRRSGSEARRLVRERDHGVCAECGLDCAVLARILRRAATAMKRYHRALLLDSGISAWSPSGHIYSALGLSQRGFLPEQSLWEADHIVPVVEGGGACGLDGYRTLCRPCHLEATARLRRRMADRAAGQIGLQPTP